MALVNLNWDNTKEALTELESLLDCGMCGRLVSVPCMLGGCEHFFCRSCIGKVAGKECPVCRMPNHVRDVQTNRQLNTAVTLCKRLSRLLNTSCQNTQTDTSQKEPETGNDDKDEEVSDQQVPSVDISPPPVAPSSPPVTPSSPSVTPSAPPVTLSSPPAAPSSPSPPPMRRTRRAAKVERKKQRLNDSNTNWGIGQEHTEKCQSCVRTNSSESKRVKFKSEGDTKQPDFEEEEVQEPKEDRLDTKKQEEPGVMECKKNTRRSKSKTMEQTESQTRDNQQAKDSFPVDIKRRVRGLKLEEKQTSKKLTTPRTCCDTKPTSSSTRNESPVSKSPASSVSVTTTPIAASRRAQMNRGSSVSPANQPWISPALAPPTGRKRRSLSPRGGVSPMIGSPLLKKNVKGETPLHIACIKGEHDTVLALLEEGAAINAKDNAGWTPLHEACNHGHSAIVASLLERGALINVPGLDNDTPLHDAVRNRRADCVRLLLQRGASRNARNVHGQRAEELADTDAVRSALNTSADEDLLRPSQVAHVEPSEVVLLGTGLSREQKTTLQKCAAMLHCPLHTDFSDRVSHVVSWVNQESQCIRTIKYLQAILTGKWIVNFHWVETCLEYGERVSEEAFEVPGARTAPDSLAPAAGRQNMMLQRPGLFAGCHVYLSGIFEYPTTSRDDLTGLLRLGGATVLSREPRAEHLVAEPCTVPYHARVGSQLERCSHYVVHGAGEGKVEEDRGRVEAGGRLCHVNAVWVLDSIAHFKLLDVPSAK